MFFSPLVVMWLEKSVVSVFPRPSCLVVVVVHILLVHRMNLLSLFNGILCNGIPN